MINIICIYQIVNKVNKKVYIGQTWDYKKRTYEHIRRLRNGNHINDHLQASWNKYGESAFYFGIIEQLDKNTTQKKLDKLEIDYINNMNYCNPEFGYNNKYGGFGSKHTDYSKKKMSQIAKSRPDTHKYCMKGIPRSEEVKLKISKSKLGHRVSVETREKLSRKLKGRQCPMKGKRHTEKSKKLMSESRMKYLRSIGK